MKKTERLMCEILERGRAKFGVVSVKAEFVWLRAWFQPVIATTSANLSKGVTQPSVC